MEVAAGIYENVGVRVDWLGCNPAGGELKHNPECGRLTPATLVVRILTRSKAEGLKQPAAALGFAMLSNLGERAHYFKRLLPPSRRIERHVDFLAPGRAGPRHRPRNGPLASWTKEVIHGRDL